MHFFLWPGQYMFFPYIQAYIDVTDHTVHDWMFFLHMWKNHLVSLYQRSGNVLYYALDTGYYWLFFLEVYVLLLICLFVCHYWRTVLLFIWFCLFKAYAISAILKIFAFEIALGRKIDLLPEVNEHLRLSFFIVRSLSLSI